MSQPLLSLMHHVTAHVRVADELAVPLPAELHYDTADPYAVCLSLGESSSTPVNWVFARALLTEGTRRLAGSGDVLVVPPNRWHPNFVRIVLRSATGRALVDIAAPKVTAFLRQTVSLVPPGTESLHIDMDRVVAQLTSVED